jgi:hypothetical protein
MTPEEFKIRWMTLGYDRSRHQGDMVEFPPDHKNGKRHAYGRNGIGRHGLLCFSNKYSVITKKNGIKSVFLISTLEKDDPFTILDERFSEAEGHGTRLEATVQSNIPNPDRIRDILSARFIHDPQFVVMVNGKTVPPTEHPGLVSEDPVTLENGVELKILFLDSTKVARTKIHQGIAFWVGNRLVGEPSWVLGSNLVIDGRTKFAKRYTFIVRTENLFEDIKPDWTGFLSSERINLVFEAVSDHVKKKLQEVSFEMREEAQCTVLRQHRQQIKELNPLAQREVSDFAASILLKHPNLKEDTLSTAVEAVINLEKSRSGKELLSKLANFSEEDVRGLNELLDKWTVRDALVVLDEIDQRISIIEAIKKLSKDESVDELHTLHPLVTQARWLFGPEFDTPEYTSNISLQNTVDHIFKKKISADAFLNHKKRPDIVVLKDSTLCAVSTEKYDENTGLFSMQTILILELKRGGATIGRDEMFQAQGYVHDISTCGLLDGAPYITAFVVGHKKSKNTASYAEISMEKGTPPIGNIKSTTYGQLVMSAEKRLFRLREFLSDRYENIPEDKLLLRVLLILTTNGTGFSHWIEGPAGFSDSLERVASLHLI